jgi:hypothetical protein
MSNPSAFVFIVNCGSHVLHDPDRSLLRLDEVFDVIGSEVIDGGTPFGDLKVEVDWKVFVYSDEFFSDGIIESLPLYLQSDFDILVLYKISLDKQRFFLCPRVFRSKVPLRNDSLAPVSFEGFKTTRILDGFLMGVG